MAKRYPGTLLEFEHWFRSDEACRAYLARLRWPDGFVCRCGARKAWITKRGLYHCARCGRDTSVTAGTIFQDTRLPLRVWFRAAWAITNQKSGINALGLQRLLGLGSYRTAWGCLRKFRGAMTRAGRDLLSGAVEVDETWIGGHTRGNSDRHDKICVMITAEIRGKEVGRIRLQALSDDSETSIKNGIRRVVAPGSELVTDGAHAYKSLVAYGYRHNRTVLAGKDRQTAGIAALPRAHLIAALLKRWLLGTYQGRVTRQKIDSYLDEFSFRFNRRSSPQRGMLFYRLIQQSAAAVPQPYK